MEYGNTNTDEVPFYWIKFQEGPVKTVGKNGCQTPDILGVMIEELERLNVGEFKTIQTTQAVKRLQEALAYLNARTAEREARGVEGEPIP